MRLVRDYTESVAKEDSMWKGETTNRQNIEGGRWVTFSRTKLPKGHNTISKETRTREWSRLCSVLSVGKNDFRSFTSVFKERKPYTQLFRRNKECLTCHPYYLSASRWLTLKLAHWHFGHSRSWLHSPKFTKLTTNPLEQFSKWLLQWKFWRKISPSILRKQ